MYKVGTRVKKTKGRQIGIVGVVCSGPAITGRSHLNKGQDMFVLMGVPWEGYEGDVFKSHNPSNTVGATHSDYWEPIQPEGSNVPSEASIHELLDSKFYEKENCNV